jgi:hypothetical protein
MFRMITTFTAIGAVMISPAFITGAKAQNVAVEITNESTIQEDDALNYFASGKKIEEEQAAAQAEQGIDGPAVPARELQYLPESLEIDGKGAAQVQMIDGRLVTKTISAPQVPQNMEAQTGAQSKTAAQPATINPSEAPKTLDAQLKAKQGTTMAQPAPTAPAPVAQQPAPAPVPVETATTPEESDAAAVEPATGVNAGVNVGQAAIVDRDRGAKINIISNTDTGVKLGQ